MNLRLKRELDSIFIKDQLFRGYLSTQFDSTGIDSISQAFNIPKDKFYEGISALMERTDSSNLVRVEQIIGQYGYPGKTLVGDTTNSVAFLVIQHSTKIDQYLTIVEKAAKADELPFSSYAMMKDRSMVYSNQPQVYGSQATSMDIVNGTTGKVERKRFIWPIADPAHVNERRRKAGFSQTIEEYAKRLGIEYSVITMQQLKL